MSKVKRNFPNLKYVVGMTDFKINLFSNRGRQLEKCESLQDVMALAKKRTPKVVFDYVEGGALEEISISRSRSGFNRVEFTPKILQDSSEVNASCEILGERVSLPIIFAPTGYTRLMHHEGEIAVCAIAAKHELIYSLSTMGTTSPAELALQVPTSRRWFQLYLMKNRENSLKLINQAKENGYEAIILTVDTPVPGIRPRDNRNGLTIPPRITLRTIFAIARKPLWWINLLTTPPLEFAAFKGWNKQLFEMATLAFDPTISYEDLKWLQKIWDGPVIVKGVQSKDDALKLVDLGVQGIIISNHGGRQLDRSVVPIEVLSEISHAVGDKIEIYIDGGVSSGQDIYAAIALGADGVLIGRSYLYGVMAGGRRGVEKVIEILKKELLNTMALMGTRNIQEMRLANVKIRPFN